MENYFREVKAIMVFLLVGLLLYGFNFLLSEFPDIKGFLIKGLIIYIGIFISFSILNFIINKKVFSKVFSIISIPYQVILILLEFVIPFLILVYHIALYFLFTIAIPVILVKALEYFDILPVKEESTIKFVEYTGSVIIAILFNYQIRSLVYALSFVMNYSSNHSEKRGFKKLTDYLLSANNVRFLIYSLYAILLIILNIFNFEKSHLNDAILQNKVILQSFVTFLAFDERALSLLKSLEFRPSDLLRTIMRTIYLSVRNYNRE